MPRSALLLGATGLVGGLCLQRLLGDPTWEQVVTLGRRSSERAHPKLTHHTVDFGALAAHAELFAATDVFCALGTTIRQAGSRAAFRTVDYEYVAESARLASAAGAEQFGLVSSLGADARSRVFYNRVKGEAENAVLRHAFRGTYIVRPSLLLGTRTEPRLGERVGALVALPFGPLLGRIRPVTADAVAAALVRVARERRVGVHVIESEMIRNLAET